MKRSVALILLSAGAGTLGLAQEKHLEDLSLLIGKQVVIQRMPLCQPGTFDSVLSYAGKTATVISAKPSAIPSVPKATIDKLPPEARAMLEDSRKSATLLFAFEDGTRLDTCAPVGPGRLSSYLELASGQASFPKPPTESRQATAEPAMVSAPPASVPPPAAATALSTLPQSLDVLSADEVKRALSGAGRDHWVAIEDMGLMAAQGRRVPGITLYMPEAIIAQRAESAKKQFIGYQPTEEDTRRVLTVVAQGYVGNTAHEGCASITRVILLSDPSGQLVKEAYSSGPAEGTWGNRHRASLRCAILEAKFPLSEVRQVMAAAPNGEFIVAVFAGPANRKMYKVKTKHQSKLGL